MSYIWKVEISNGDRFAWSTYKGEARNIDEACRKAKRKAEAEGCKRPVVTSAVREGTVSW